LGSQVACRKSPILATSLPLILIPVYELVQKFSKAMQIKPEDLTKAGYSLYKKLEHDELIPFVKKNLHKWSLISIFFCSMNFGLFVLVVFQAWISITKHDIAIGDLVFS
jgi:hypothetical protein